MTKQSNIEAAGTIVVLGSLVVLAAVIVAAACCLVYNQINTDEPFRDEPIPAVAPDTTDAQYGP